MNESSYWPIVTKIELMQRMVIVHSIIYYELDSSVVSDVKYDKLARKLAKMKDTYPEEWRRSQYFYCMRDFSSSTGFDLFGRLNEHDKKYLLSMANTVLTLYKQEKGTRC